MLRVVVFITCLTAGFSFGTCTTSNVNNGRDRRDVPEECRFGGPPRSPKPPNGDQETAHLPPPVCCELPDFLSFVPEGFAKCHEVMHNGNQGGRKGLHGHSHIEMMHRIKRSNDKEDSKDDNGPMALSQDRKDGTCVITIDWHEELDGRINCVA